MRMESSYEDAKRNMECLEACILIALNNNGGVRPVGIGEVLRKDNHKSPQKRLNEE